VIGNCTTVGSLNATGTIVNNGNLTFNRTNTVTQGTEFSTAAITGTGNLVQAGTGNLILTAANTYNGTTRIESGTLVIGNGTDVGSLNATSTIVNNGTLTFNRTDTVTQGSQFSTAGITGTGNLTQNGTGTLILNATNTYNGTTGVAGSWTGNLSITNWLQGGGINTRVFFGSSNTSLTSGQLSQISGFSGDGTGPLGSPTLADNGELIFSPIPEPGTVAVVLLLGLFLAWRERGTLSVLLLRRRSPADPASAV
jgi:fibronectin-binding autotransporter adhesin